MRAEHRGSARRPVVRALVLLVAVAMASGLVAAVPAASKTPPTLTLGSITLHRCVDDVNAWCGFKPEPLDPFMTRGPMIHVGFVWFPATGTATGTVVADEGGPGFPSTGSAPEYRDMYGPLLTNRNLLLVDNRGTGRSAAIDCPALQRYQGSTVGLGLPADGGRVRPQAQPHVEGAGRRVDPRVGPVRHRVRRQRHGGHHQVAGRGAGRPVRRLLRHVVRAIVPVAPSGAAAFGGAGFGLSDVRRVLVVPVRGLARAPGVPIGLPSRSRVPARGARGRAVAPLRQTVGPAPKPRPDRGDDGGPQRPPRP